jgi:hypothetical protein
VGAWIETHCHELLSNLGEAVTGCLSVDLAPVTMTEKDYIIDILVQGRQIPIS